MHSYILKFSYLITENVHFFNLYMRKSAHKPEKAWPESTKIFDIFFKRETY